MSEAERTLTDADVDAIASAMEKKLESRFYSNLGKGVWAIIWKVVLTGLLLIAAYGIGQSGGVQQHIGAGS